MAPTHRYDLIADHDDVKDEPQNDTTDRISIISPWWKYLLYLLLAFSAGLGAAVGVVLANSYIHHGDNSASSPAASTSLATDLAVPTTSATLAADLASPTVSIDETEHEVDASSGLDGKVLDCGWSPEEARAKGCVYDVMMQDWVPEPCYDEVLTERYLAKGNWTWYTDVDGDVMSDEEMRKGDHHMAWMSASYHQAHCVFSWEKLIRALRNKRGISQELLSYDHVLHCRMQTLGSASGMMRKRDEGAISVGAPTNYAKCALYDTWKEDFIPDKHDSTQ